MATPTPVPPVPPDDGPSINTLELVLISVAVALTITLSFLPSPRHRAQHNAATTPPVVIFVSLLIAVSAVALAVASLLLGWFRRISLDALAAVVFALVPVLVKMPLDLFHHVVHHLRMCRHLAMQPFKPSFRYVRLGKSCGADLHAAEWRPIPHALVPCPGPPCTAALFIRHISPRPPRRARAPDHDPRLHATTQWYGTRVGHSRHCVQLRDHNEGVKAWNWAAVVSATWLVAEPSLARLSTQQRVLQALIAISDIIAIGDLVLARRRSLVKQQLLHNHGVRRAISATPAFVCNALIEKLGLGWGSITPALRNMNIDDLDDQHAGVTTVYPLASGQPRRHTSAHPDASGGVRTCDHCAGRVPYPKDQLAEYGLLLFIITEKSKLFSPNYMVDDASRREIAHGDARFLLDQENRCSIDKVTIKKVERVSASHIIDKLYHAECDNEAGFITEQTRLVDDWLESWGWKVRLKPQANVSPMPPAPVAGLVAPPQLSSAATAPLLGP